MFKLASAVLLAAVSIAPAQAATSIILNSGNTDLPTFTTAAVFQNFNVPTTGVTPFAPNSTVDNSVFAPANVATESTTGLVTRITTRDAGLAGMSQDYLAIANAATYTVSFLDPVAFFSFAFNIAASPGDNAFVTLNFVDGSETYNGVAAILGSPSTLPAFGRVSYDVGSGSRITSVTIGKTTGANTNRFVVENIAAAVPEPAAWLMMILGFGLVGGQLRRGKGKAKLAAA